MGHLARTSTEIIGPLSCKERVKPADIQTLITAEDKLDHCRYANLIPHRRASDQQVALTIRLTKSFLRSIYGNFCIRLIFLTSTIDVELWTTTRNPTADQFITTKQ